MEKASKQIRLSKLALEGSRRAGFSGQGSQGLPEAGPGWAGSGGVIRRGEITLELVVVSWVSWASKAANRSTQSESPGLAPLPLALAHSPAQGHLIARTLCWGLSGAVEPSVQTGLGAVRAGQLL